MKHRIVASALLTAALAWAQSNPAGHWEGAFRVNDREIALTLDLAKNTKSEWIGSMGMTSAGLTGLVVMDISVNGESVKFTAVELGMSKIDLTLAPDGSLKGTIASPQGSLPIAFKRTGEPKVELIPPSPAVSKALEGDWEGSMEVPGGRTFRIILHFRNQPDNTVTATIDTPDTAGMNLPLNSVKQTGDKVEFGIKIAHAGFQGNLNPEGTQLTGQWTHESDAMPIVLHKK